MRHGAAVLLVALAGCTTGGDDSTESAPGPEEGLIAFTLNVRGSTDLAVMRPDGAERRRLTNTPETDAQPHEEGQPAWSPDGRRLAFITSADHPRGGWERGEIAVANADGTNVRRLTANETPEVDPHWTPEGDVAFTSCTLRDEELPQCALRAVAPNGSRLRTMVSGLGFTFTARLSPDGEEVAWTRLDARFRATLWVRRVDGGQPRPLGSGSAPRWSPDGERIVFVDDRDRNGRCLFHDCVGSAPEVYVMDAHGGDATRLTRTVASEGSPSFTPDGDHIVFSRIADEEDDHDLVLAAADGSCERPLTDTPVWELSPAWIGGGARC